MAKRKLKVTGFTRFILFLLIFSPIAFIIASYANGEDGIQKIKDFVGEKVEQVSEQTSSAKTEKAAVDTVSLNECQSEIDKLAKRLDRRDAEIDKLQDEIESLKKQLNN